MDRSSEIDLLTLVIAAAASAVAAFVTSQVWEGGTIIAAAMTPVIVALVKEALARPADRIATTLPLPRRAGEIDANGDEQPDPPVTVHRSSGRRWRVAIVSGLAAFALVVALFTVPELLAGSSAGRGGDSRTTFFGGSKSGGGNDKRKDAGGGEGDGRSEEATPEPTEAAEETETPEPTAVEETPEPTATATPEPTVVETPAPTVTP